MTTPKPKGWTDRYNAFRQEQAQWPEWLRQWRRDNPVGTVQPKDG